MTTAGETPMLITRRRLSAPPPSSARAASIMAWPGFGDRMGNHRQWSRLSAITSRPSGSAAPPANTGVAT